MPVSERFELLEQLGRGGMGVVWKARDHDSGEIVALKLLHAMFIDDKDYVARFEREVEVVRRITSPNVVRVLGYGQRDGVPYFAMEYIEGPSLREAILGRGPLGWGETRRIAADIAVALSGAHEVGVVHRDVKPSNILLGPQGARLADFGIAKASDLTRLTGSSTMLGTPHYMAPDGDASPAADWYALGCVIFEALCGDPPFTGDSMQQVLIKHIRQDADLGRIDAAARELVGALLEKEPGERMVRARPLILELVGEATRQTGPQRPLTRTMKLTLEREFIGKSYIGAASVTTVALSPTEALVAAGFADGAMRIWGIHGGAARQPERQASTPVTGIEFSPAGAFIAVSEKAGRTAIHHVNGRLFAPPGLDGTRMLAFDGSGDLMATVGRESGVSLVRAPWAPGNPGGSNGEPRPVRDVIAAAGRRPAFSPSDAFLAVAQPFAGVAVVDVATGQATAVPRTPSSGDVLAVGFVDDQTLRWAAGAMVWDWPIGGGATPPVLVAVLPTTQQPLAFSPTLDTVAYVHDGALNVATLPRRVLGRTEVTAAASTPRLPSYITALCVSADGTRIASGHVDGSVRVFQFSEE